MVMTKKGVFFTSIAIILLGALILSVNTYTQYNLRNKELVVETRINTIDQFIVDIEKDMTRAVLISSHRSLLAMIQKIVETGDFLDNSKQSFKEAIIYGSVEGTNQTIIENNTLTDWINKMKKEGGAIDLIVEIQIEEVTPRMKDSWNFESKVNFTIYVEDVLKTASWNLSKEITATINIMGFEDPLYTVNTNGKVINIINKTPYSSFVSGVDTSNLQNHMENSFYIEWNGAPDFLMRLEGNTSPSVNGIESLINLDKLSAQGFSILEKSVVDHYYWSSKSQTIYNISNMPSWFKLDSEYIASENSNHTTFYEVENLIS